MKCYLQGFTVNYIQVFWICGFVHVTENNQMNKLINQVIQVCHLFFLLMYTQRRTTSTTGTESTPTKIAGQLALFDWDRVADDVPMKSLKRTIIIK